MGRFDRMFRRAALKASGAGCVGALAGLRGAPILRAEEASAVKGHVNQSVSRWCFKMTLDDLCSAAKKIGYRAIDLLGPKDVGTVKKYGLTCSMLNCEGVSIANGLNRKENHEKIEAGLRKAIDFAAENGLPNVITFSGNRQGMSDEEGAENCVAGLKRVAGYAAEKKVTICIELLNSKVNHKDYMADHTAWGATVCQKVGSERVKVLYDIYHMQIMEGDVIATIQKHKGAIGHYHTGGVPGRAEIDETQELNYPAILRAIVETGYKEFVGQEFIPKRDPLTSLAQAFKICDV
jgi:hydroxypyruvate isomerase